jgi:hypothetical protein
MARRRRASARHMPASSRPKQQARRGSSRGHGVWVPAFAGTTGEASGFVVESKARVRPTFLGNEQGAADSAPATRKQTVHATQGGIVFRASFLLGHRLIERHRIVVESRTDVRPTFPKNEQGAADSAPVTRKQTVHAARRGIAFRARLLRRQTERTRIVVESRTDVRSMFPRNEQGVADSAKATGKQTVHDAWQRDFFAHASARAFVDRGTADCR